MKKISKIKRIFVLCLIFLLSINSFAAVVSDNDGSTFITKSEFDEIKLSFTKQIYDYNNSISGKINGAIASYLSGVQIAKEWELKTLFNSFNVSTISSKRNSDIVWEEDLQGWNCRAAYYSFYNALTYAPPNGIEAAKGGTVAWTISPEAGKRGLYNEETVGGTTAYRWAGYATDFKQTNSAEFIAGVADADVGYATSGTRKQYLNGWMYEDTSITETSKIELVCTKSQIYLNDTNTGTGHNLSIPYSMIFSSTYAYTLNDAYSFIFNDPTAASSSAKNLRKEKDNKYWARGSTSNFTQKSIWNNKASLNSTDTILYVCLINGSYGNGQFVNQPTEKANNTNKFTCKDEGQMITSPLEAFKSDVTWKNILHHDISQYNYKDGEVDKIISNYNMLNGIPLLIVEENHRYIWPVKFSETSNINVYLKYGVFDGDGTPNEANCLKVSATEGGTKTNYATISSGSGQICFDADKNGIVFVKWRLASDADGGGTLNAANSGIVYDKKIDV